MYSDKKIADEWYAWTKTFEGDDIRPRLIYPWLTRWLHETHPEKVLEIGSGTGLCSERVDFGSADYVGVEPSLHLRTYASQLYPNRKFLGGKAERLPVETGSIDAAFSVFVWLHIQDLTSAADELNRILKPGGNFAIVTANPETYELWLSWHINPQVRGKEVKGDMKHLSGHQMYLHSMNELKESLDQAGLKISTVDKFISKKDPTQYFSLVLAGTKKS